MTIRNVILITQPAQRDWPVTLVRQPLGRSAPYSGFGLRSGLMPSWKYRNVVGFVSLSMLGACRHLWEGWGLCLIYVGIHIPKCSPPRGVFRWIGGVPPVSVLPPPFPSSPGFGGLSGSGMSSSCIGGKVVSPLQSARSASSAQSSNGSAVGVG